MPVEQAAAQVVDPMATKKEIEALNEFIGGFENWSILIEDCRLHVAKFLDFNAARHLEMCSQQDRATIEKTPIHLHSMEIDQRTFHDWENNAFFNYSNVRIHISKDSNKHYDIRFKDVVGGTEIYSTQCESDINSYYECFREVTTKGGLFLKDCNHEDEAVKFFEKWLKRCDYKVNKLTIKMTHYPRDTSEIKSLPSCEEIRLNVANFETVDWWLQRCPAQIEMLAIDDSWQGQGPVLYPLDFMNRPQVVNAGCLFLSRAIPVTDAQFMNLKAGSVSIDSKSITDRCINQFIKNWVNGKCVESFTQYTFKSQAMERVTSVILQGVQQNIALSGPDQFFCCSCEKPCGRGDYYVIPSLVDPNDYISVFFCAHYMVIAIKGAEQEGLIKTARF